MDDVTRIDGGNLESGVLRFYFEAGYFGLLAYAVSIILILVYVSKNGNIWLVMTVISSALYALRSGEILPPVFFFFLSLTLTEVEHLRASNKTVRVPGNLWGNLKGFSS